VRNSRHQEVRNPETPTSHQRRSHGPLCSQKGLKLGKGAYRESEIWGFQVHVHIDNENAEFAMSEIPMGFEPLDQALIEGLLLFLTH
jgi:hypothetical protein